MLTVGGPCVRTAGAAAGGAVDEAGGAAAGAGAGLRAALTTSHPARAASTTASPATHPARARPDRPEAGRDCGAAGQSSISVAGPGGPGRTAV